MIAFTVQNLYQLGYFKILFFFLCYTQRSESTQFIEKARRTHAT